jgi:hypothetical protein
MVNIPREILEVIDARAAQVLVASTPILNGITARAAEQQARTGIAGPAGHGIYVGAYFDFFKRSIEELFATTLKIADIVSGWETSDLLAYLDAKAEPFRTAVEQPILRISRAPYSRGEPNLAIAYARLRQGLLIELSLMHARHRAKVSSPATVIIQNSSGFQVGDHNTQHPSS